MTQETVLEVRLEHLTHNYTYLKGKIAETTKFMAVVKAAGYGSEAVSVATHLQKLGVDAFAVAYVSEGIVLRKAGIKVPILVLHPQPVRFSELIRFQLEPNIYSIRILTEFIKVLDQKNEKAYPVHLKFNTGLNRIGFSSQEISEIKKMLKKTEKIEIKGLMSHLAASEDERERSFTLQQIKDFHKIAYEMTDFLGFQPILHQSNTSGILKYPEAHFDMVRSGIGLYGFGNEAIYDQNLKPISSLKSVISQIQILQPGDTLGYNRAFKAKKTTRTATIPIGHADGIGRQYGNRNGFVFINGQKAYILGNVCMDMIMVDVTDIQCQEGDEVIIFGNEKSAALLAEASGTISYELLTAISPRVQRIIVSAKT